jgi:amino acid adenylation domain-containing protein
MMMPTPYQRFARVADELPDAPAIDLGDSCLSYGVLAELVRRVAGHLHQLDLPPGSRIGLLGIRRLETYVVYLAILRARHVVVPLGTEHPVEASLAIAETAGLRAAFVDPGLRSDLYLALQHRGIALLAPRECADSAATAFAEQRSGPDGGQPDELMYVMFTSGSTGRPKGVPITNRNVSHFLDRVVPRYELGPGARMSHTFALTFDPSVFDLFGAWTSGATLVLPRNRELLLPSTYVSERVLTHWFSVPSLAAYGRRIGSLGPGSMPGLRWTGFIGEPLPIDLAESWRQAAPASIIENVYGPTELTISCTDYRLPDDLADLPRTSNATLPIGRVYRGLEWRVVDQEGISADDGELIIRGPQRFGGYLNPEDNARRFLGAADAESVPVDDLAWYRTGDRVRRSGDLLIHLGRLDRQVKVNGYRIELGEVEAAVRRHPAVTDVAVVTVADDHGSIELFAAWCGAEMNDEDVVAALRDWIPAYMIPTRFMRLPDLPVNTSGKVDYLRIARLAGDRALHGKPGSA